MLSHHLKPWKDRWIVRLSPALAAVPLSANQISLLSAALAIPAAVSVLYGRYWDAMIWMALGNVLDLLDGLKARIEGGPTPFGGYLDCVCDKLREVILYAGLIGVGYAWSGAAAMTSSVLVSYAKSAAAHFAAVPDEHWPSLGCQTDRMVVLALTAILRGSGLRHLWGMDTVSLGLTTVAVLAIVGTAQRILYARRALGSAAGA